MTRILRDWFTGPDNEHYELARAIGFAAFVLVHAALFLAIARFGYQYSFTEHCQGLLMLLPAIGAFIWLKQRGAPPSINGGE